MARWHNCPSLAVFWCNGIFVVFYLYTIYAASTRYNQFKINSMNPKYGFNWNENYIVFYLVCILIACLFWLLHLYSTIFQTGNLANDCVELGKITSVLDDPINSTKCIPVCGRILQRIRYHFIPFNSMLHLFGAFFLLVPIPLLIEEESKHDVTHFGYGYNKSFILCIYIPEIINFLLASFCMTVRLPTVFSSTSKSFGIIYSIVIFAATTNILVHCLANQLIISYQSKFNWRIAITNIAIFVVSSSNFCFMYEHGRSRFLDSIYIRRIDSQDQASSKSGLTSFGRSIGDKYWSNIIAFILWIAVVALYIEQYCMNIIFNSFYLFDICISITHCLIWLIVWLLFTFKSDWEFTSTRTQMKVSGISPEHSFRAPITCAKPCDTIYTCFQISDQIRSISSQSSKTPNHDISSTSSSGSSRMSEKTPLQNHIPSISKQMEFTECNYDDIGIYRSNLRMSKNPLKEISEEHPEYQERLQKRLEISPTELDFFKSPNISQRSSNLHSSDSGIGINFRDNPDYVFCQKVPETEVLKYRAFTPQTNFISKVHEYNIDEELVDQSEIVNTNLCSDV